MSGAPHDPHARRGVSAGLVGGLFPVLGAVLPVLVIAAAMLTSRHGDRQPDADTTSAPPVSAAAVASATAATAAAPPPSASSPTQMQAARRSTDFNPQPPPWQQVLARHAEAAPTGAAPPSATSCAGCHGGNGVPAGDGPTPRLAGLQAEYIAKQLMDYRSGLRPNPVMGPVAQGLQEADIAALARYYAGLPTPPAEPAGAGRAQQLQAAGDNALALPACANCHGPAGQGEGNLLPPLLGQPAAYFQAQMGVFRAGTRRNDGEGVMRAIAQRLSDEDVNVLAIYYAGGGARPR